MKLIFLVNIDGNIFYVNLKNDLILNLFSFTIFLNFFSSEN